MTTTSPSMTPQMNTFKNAYNGVKQQYPQMYANSIKMIEQVEAAGIDCRICFRCWNQLSHTRSEQQFQERYTSIQLVKTQYEDHKTALDKFVKEINLAISAFDLLSEEEKTGAIEAFDDEGNSDLPNSSSSSECGSKNHAELLQFKVFCETLQKIMFSYEDSDPHGFIQSFNDSTEAIKTSHKGRCNPPLPQNDSAPLELQTYIQLIDEAQKRLDRHLKSLKMLTTATLTMHVFNNILAQDATLLLKASNDELQKYQEREKSYTLYQQEHETLTKDLDTTIDHLSYLHSDASRAALALLKDQKLLNDQLSHRFAIAWQGHGKSLTDTLFSKTHTLYFTKAHQELSVTVAQNAPQKPQELAAQNTSTSFLSSWNPFTWGTSSSTITQGLPQPTPTKPPVPETLKELQEESKKTQKNLNEIKQQILEHQSTVSNTNTGSEEIERLKKTITELSSVLANFPQSALSTLNAVDAYTKIKSLACEVRSGEEEQPENGSAFITNTQTLMEELAIAQDDLLLKIAPQIKELSTYIHSLVCTSVEELAAPLQNISLHTTNNLEPQISDQHHTTPVTQKDAVELVSNIPHVIESSLTPPNLKEKILNMIRDILANKDSYAKALELNLSKSPSEQQQFQGLLNSIRNTVTQIPAPVLKKSEQPTPAQLIAQTWPVLHVCTKSLEQLTLPENNLNKALNDINDFCEQITRLSIIITQPS